MATSPKANFVSNLLNVKNRTQNGLQAVGRNMTANIKKGNADFESGKAPYYSTTNPLKGAKAAFMSGYGK